MKDIYLSPQSFFHGRTTDRVLFIGINWCYGVEVDCLLVLQPFQPQVEIGLQWHIGVREGEGESKEGNSYGRWKKTKGRIIYERWRKGRRGNAKIVGGGRCRGDKKVTRSLKVREGENLSVEQMKKVAHNM